MRLGKSGNKKKILIIGNLGYVGDAVTKFFYKNNVEVSGIDQSYFGDCVTSFLKVSISDKMITNQKTKDVRSLKLEDLKGFNSIVYLAAISNDAMGDRFKKLTREINYKSALKIAKLAKIAGVKKFLFASSCSIYGISNNDYLSENNKTNPLTEYARSKLDAEIELKKLATQKFKIINLRFGTACGYSDRLRLDLVLNDFVYTGLMTNKIILLSAGNQWRPFIHIKDMAKAIYFFSEKYNKKNFLTINVGSNSMNLSIIALAREVSKTLKNCKIIIKGKTNNDQRSYKVNFNLFKKITPKKYLPSYNLKKSVKDLHKSIQQNFKELDKNFRKGNLIRLNYLNNLIASKILNKSLNWKFKF